MILKYTFLISVSLIVLFNYYAKCEDDYNDDYTDNDSDCSANGKHCNVSSNNTANNNTINCDENQLSFVDTVKLIHSEGVNATVVINVNDFNDTIDRMDNVFRVARKLYATQETAFNKAFKMLAKANLTEMCVKSIAASLNAYRNNDFWPQKFIDSSGKIPNGLLSVVFASLGDFDQCINIKSPPIDKNGLIITGKYCLLEIEIPIDKDFRKGKLYAHANNFVQYYGLHHVYKPDLADLGKVYLNDSTFRWAICVPSQCDANEIQDSINKVLLPVTRGINVKIIQKCQVKNQDYLLDGYEVFSIYMLSFLTILVILSTGFELYLSHLKQWVNFIKSKNDEISDNTSRNAQYLLSFSLIKNTKSLFEESSRFSSLDTIKLFIIFNIYAIHVYAFTPLIGTITVKNYFTTVPVQFLHSNKYFLLRSPQILDALFVMSGFIFSYGMLGKLRKSNGKFSFISYITLRWIRFVLAVGGSFLFFNLLPLLGDGPVWEYGTTIFMYPCKSPISLLSSVLQISNFFQSYELVDGGPKMGICNIPTWFMSAIFQLQIIAPFYVVLYYRKRKLALSLTIATIIGGLFLIILPNFFGIKPYTQYAHLVSVKTLLQEFHWYHVGTNSYVSMFFVGILFGLGLRNNVRVNRLATALLWFLSVTVIVLVFLWNNKLWQIDPTAMTDFDAMLWLTFGKLLSALAFAWIFYACCSGSAGLFSLALNWSGFRPLNKLSFSIFLTHMMIVVLRIFTIKQPISITDSQMIHNIIIDLILSTALAYVFYILIDSPVSNIVSIVTRPMAKPNQQHGDNTTQINTTDVNDTALANNNNNNNNHSNINHNDNNHCNKININNNYISIIRL